MIESDAIQKKINELLASFSGAHSLNELFPPEFIQGYSTYTNAKELFSLADITDQESFDRWLSSCPSSFIAQHTKFMSWDEMFRSAGEAYANNCLAARRKGKQFSVVLGDTFDSIKTEVNLCAL